jgi:predicted glycoside hydrolase/deacetylase ChbG (UPF0249 family)
MGVQQNLKQIIMCADDYGITPAVGDGIRQLVVAQRLSAVSCISNAPGWPGEAVLLKRLHGKIDVGLHFNLTLGFTQPAKSLSEWIRKSLTCQIDHLFVEREFSKQLDLFESAWGVTPDFIDGHHHVHIFPGIRKIIFHLLSNRYSATEVPWIRQVKPALIGHDAHLKALQCH